MCGCNRVLHFLFGAFIIVFTFVAWAPAGWIAFAIGIWLVLQAIIGDKCFCKTSCDVKPKVKTPKPKKIKKKK